MAPKTTADLALTEKQFQGQVLDLARLFGWRAYHTFDSRRSAAGFPDLVMVRDGRLIFAELKATAGRISADQFAWMQALQEAEEYANPSHPGVDVYDDGKPKIPVRYCLWRPADWAEIEEILR